MAKGQEPLQIKDINNNVGVAAAHRLNTDSTTILLTGQPGALSSEELCMPLQQKFEELQRLN